MKNISKIADNILKRTLTKFTTNVKDANISLTNIKKWNKLENKDAESADITAELIVDWEADIEMRDWGIKAIEAIVRNVHGNINVSFWGDVKDIVIDYEFDAEKEGFTVISKMKFVNDLLPRELTIDFSNKKVIIE